MSSSINFVGMAAPPRRVVVASVNPASSLPSSRMAARDRAQNWRGKYLSALNICPADIETARRLAEKTTHHGKPRVRAMSLHRSDFADHHALSRSYSSSTEKEEDERKSLEKSVQHQHQHQYDHFQPPRPGRMLPQEHRIHAVPLRAPSTQVSAAPMGVPVRATASNPYGFPMRPDISRGRRCHTDPSFLLDERVSAPIQIPSATRVNNQLDGNDRHDVYDSSGQRRRASPQSIQPDQEGGSSNHHSTNVRLLSWEEPVAMLKAADAVSKGWQIPHASEMELGVRRARGDDHDNIHHMDEDEDDNESHHGDIFAMDESEDEASTNQPSSTTASTKSRRRYRTESMNIVTSGREKRTHHEYDNWDRNGGDHVDDHVDHRQDLSTSFVPPHQMVDRTDCFSIGLRDEFKKRRPINHI